MRFYMGFSNRINLLSLLKWVGLIVGGFLAFFGIDKLTAHALTNTQAPSAVKTCDFNGLFTDSNCVTEQPYNCSMSGLSSPFSCYVPSNDLSNLRPVKKSVWYSYTNTSSSSGGCNTSQTISFNVDIIMQDQFQANGAPSNATAEDGPWPPNALNYNAWNNVNPTTRGALTKSVSNTKSALYDHDMYWQYLDSANSKNKTGVKIYGYSSSTGYQIGSCQFVSYLNYKTIRFLCSAPAKMSTYYVGQNIYNTNGLFASANTPNSYIRPVQYISNVSDPCVSSSTTDMSGVTSAINNQTSSIMSGFSDVIENNNNNTSEIVEGLEGVQDKQQQTNDKLDDLNDKQQQTNDELGEINGNTTSCKEDVFNASNNPFDSNKGFLNISGYITSNDNFRYTDYLKLGTKSNLIVRSSTVYSGANYCLYDYSKTLIRCYEYSTNSEYIITDSNAKFLRLSYRLDSLWSITLTRCSGMGDYLADDSFDSSSTSDFFNNSNGQDRHGVGSILTAPIRLYQALIDNSVDYDSSYDEPSSNRGGTKDGGGTGFSCEPLMLHLSLVNASDDIELPCGAIFWNNVDSNFISIYNVAVWGLLAFSVCKMFVKMVHRVLDPDYKKEMDDLTASKDL